jgi:hypothetical protein
MGQLYNTPEEKKNPHFRNIMGMEITGQQNIGQFDTDYNNAVYTSNIHAGKHHIGTPVDGLSGASIYIFQ